MKIHFWGVRGSLPTPITSEQIQSKIMAVIQRIKPSDLINSETRAKFTATLPNWIMGTVGGNSSCVEIQDENTQIILDAGSGIRVLGKEKNHLVSNHIHLFFSHFHWDHIQGLPFFDAAYNPNTIFDIYSAKENAKEILSLQMTSPYYPVTWDSFTKNIKFHTVTPNKSFMIDNIEVNCSMMSHPGNSHSFSFSSNGKKFVYATDVELKTKDFQNTSENVSVFKDADVIVLDSQYTVEEAYRKKNWGHSAFCYAIDFAVYWNIKKLYLFHHEPTYDDKKLDSILQSARWYAQYINHSEIEIQLAKEGDEFTL